MVTQFKVVYTFLAINFLLPALYYCFDPKGSAELYYSLAGLLASCKS